MGDRLYVYMIHDQPIPSIRGHEGNKPRVDFRFKQKMRFLICWRSKDLKPELWQLARLSFDSWSREL